MFQLDSDLTVSGSPALPYRRSSPLVVRCLLLFTVGSLSAGVVAADVDAKAAAGVIEPADCFMHVRVVRDELEQLRFVMGRPKNTQPELDVLNAAPREVYFQALTLFRKADRLSFEFTREHAPEPEVPSGPIRPAAVDAVVDAALQRIRSVRQRLKIDYQATPVERDPAKNPTHVFCSIVQANRQLNLLLDRQLSPADVYQQVTLAVGYTSRLLAEFSDPTRIPQEPAFAEGKRPTDVYRRLTDCLERVRRISELSGQQMLTLNVTAAQWENATPSDVYDIASLLVSELAFLHSKLANARPPRRVVYPGRSTLR